MLVFADARSSDGGKPATDQQGEREKQQQLKGEMRDDQVREVPAAKEGDPQVVEQKIPDKKGEESGEATGEQTPEELKVEQADKIPSFDDWKQKMLAEQAEQEKTKQLEGL